MVRNLGPGARYDVILADIRLPDMNGYELLLQLREVLNEVPLVLMTGFGYDPGHCIIKARAEGREAHPLQAVPSGPAPKCRGEHDRERRKGEGER